MAIMTAPTVAIDIPAASGPVSFVGLAEFVSLAAAAMVPEAIAVVEEAPTDVMVAVDTWATVEDELEGVLLEDTLLVEVLSVDRCSHDAI